MSNTPAEKFEVAADGDASHDERTVAIEELETANDCSRLADLARMDDIDDRYRERAALAMATPQCKETLAAMVDEGDLPRPLAREAESLLEDVPDHTGPST